MLEARIRNTSLFSLIKRTYSSGNEALLEGPNNSFLPFIYNRNPRNLERLRIAPKPSGYVLDKKPVNYWHRLVIEQSNKHWNAYIEHFEGSKVVTASTKEWAIKQFLRSTSDSVAAAIVGKVLAQRCLEFGLLEVNSDYDLKQTSPKITLVLKNIEKGGIALKEPEQFLPHRHWSREVKEDPTKVYEETQSR
ncbi:39S ribosomal protein L18, mitochondrial-like [Daphnia pulex]|uniref:39S ribosomal protein L18, mitochondrial-like n=1 Tax=Daphnia pulex TaxID=6669 RepID=UPI001EDF3844|nr:39S ribosomal protein L18, mitochondrial-like [Daphnia pulex]